MLKVSLFCLIVTIAFICFLNKAEKHYKEITIKERKESLYRDSSGINSNYIINKYEY